MNLRAPPFSLHTVTKVGSPQRVILEDSAPKRPSTIKVGAQLDVTFYQQQCNILLVRISRNSKPVNQVTVFTVGYPTPIIGRFPDQRIGVHACTVRTRLLRVKSTRI